MGGDDEAAGEPDGPLLVSDWVEERYGARLEALAPDLERRVLRPGDAPESHRDARLFYFSGDLYPDRTRDAAVAALKSEGLRWLHTFSAGVDNPFFHALMARGVVVTTSSGAMAVPIAHTVMLYLLALSRDLPGWLADQAAHRWAPRPVEDLQGRTLGIVGLGPIGREVARLGQAFGMRVLGVRRRPVGDEPCETWGWERLPELLACVDDLVLAVPLTEETRDLLDRDALSRMKAGARLVNVARGEIVDEEALVDAIRRGHLKGAGLDVFREEPLAVDSPLWETPGVLVTPHSSGTNPGNWERATEIFLENLVLWRRGDPLRNRAPSSD